MNATEHRAWVLAMATHARETSERMLERAKSLDADLTAKSTVIRVSRDEYMQIGMTFVNMASVADELHALLAETPTRAELLTINVRLASLAAAMHEASREMNAIVARIAPPATVE
jgi:hypothetical protein